MKTFPECTQCFVKQSVALLTRLKADSSVQKMIISQITREINSVDSTTSPPEIASRVHRSIRQATGEKDPFLAEKKRFNSFALSLLPQIREKLLFCGDTLSARVRLAIAGNIIDSGTNSSLNENDVEDSINKALAISIDEDAVQRLFAAAEKAENILYLCDNAGEIVFDRLLIECLPKNKITCAVRGFPILNDATMEDARETGLADLVKVIDNGSDAPGTILKLCRESFRKRFAESDLIISKGQGNYETLNETAGKQIFFLFQAKCPVVVRYTGRELGSYIIMDSQ
jgi:uncharacterized protein with ATP-grasp and redox domains